MLSPSDRAHYLASRRATVAAFQQFGCDSYFHLHEEFVQKEACTANACKGCRESLRKNKLPVYCLASGYDFGSLKQLGTDDLFDLTFEFRFGLVFSFFGQIGFGIDLISFIVVVFFGFSFGFGFRVLLLFQLTRISRCRIARTDARGEVRLLAFPKVR
jgi:hypothetical protein